MKLYFLLKHQRMKRGPQIKYKGSERVEISLSLYKIAKSRWWNSGCLSKTKTFEVSCLVSFLPFYPWFWLGNYGLGLVYLGKIK